MRNDVIKQRQTWRTINGRCGSRPPASPFLC